MIPMALFAMSLAPGLLNAAYAAMLLGGCLVATMHLEPPVTTAVLQFNQVALSLSLSCYSLLCKSACSMGCCALWLIASVVSHFSV